MAKDDQDLSLIVRLRETIATCGLSHSELARRAKVAQSQISRFMSGKTITVITAARLFEYFGLRVSPAEPVGDLEPDDVDAETNDEGRPLGKRK